MTLTYLISNAIASMQHADTTTHQPILTDMMNTQIFYLPKTPPFFLNIVENEDEIIRIGTRKYLNVEAASL